MITIRNYTKEELEYIQHNYNTMSVKELSEKLNKSYNSIGNVARKLGLIKQIHNKWTDEENNYLINNYATQTAEQIAMNLNRTNTSVFAQVNRLGLNKEKNWTKEEIQYLKENFDKMQHSEIGQVLHRTQSAITAKCFDLGLYKKELPWTDEELSFVEESYMEMPTSDIAKMLNRTTNAIKLKAERMGLKKYPYHCDYHYFDNIDTEEKAYWLGFLIADGWINKNDKNNAGVIGIELQYGDIEHLRKFNKSLNGNYRITDRWRKCVLSENNNEHHMCILRVFSLTMYDSLRSLGFDNDKSYSCNIPLIDKNLIRHFIRGYFDGDGCFTCTNKSFNIGIITASEHFNNSFVELMKNCGFNFHQYSYINEFGTVMFRPCLYKNSDKIKFLDWIYQDCNVYLDRKYKKYLKAKQKYTDNNESLAS